MTAQPAIHLGDYGDGTVGLKTSLPGYDVTVRGDDNDVEKRSFNSEWADLLKVRAFGVVSSTPKKQEWYCYNSFDPGAGTPFVDETWNQSWYWSLPIVPLPVDYIPLWEERIYDPTTKLFYDDDCLSTSARDWSGGRSWITAQATQNDYPNNTDWVVDGNYSTNSQTGGNPPRTRPSYAAKCLVFDPNWRSHPAPDYNTAMLSQNHWFNTTGGPRGWPGFKPEPVSARSA